MHHDQISELVILCTYFKTFFFLKDHIMVLIFALHNTDIKIVFCYFCSYASAPIVLTAAL